MIEKDPYLQSYITDDEGKVYAVPGCIATPTNLYGLVINRGFYDMEDKDRTIDVNEVVDIFKRLGKPRPVLLRHMPFV
ncbi:MAG TPA: hypothetical protein DDZ89_21280 [Clostridiales bacterium]|nr:hypothetical protein [Clostridiales bacterium]